MTVTESTEAPAAFPPDTMDPVLSAWSTVSPFGLGSAEFAAGLHEGRSGVVAVDDQSFPTASDPGPPDGELAGLVPEFSPRSALGRKGTRSMDRLTAIAVATVGQLIDGAEGEPLADRQRVGLVLGTGSGSLQSIMDFSADSLRGDKPYDVDPALFPNTVMNKAAAQSAIWHGVQGPNATVTGDALSGLLALRYAIRLCRGGHCDRALVGAADEYSATRAWLERTARENDARAPLGEGGAMFLIEDRADAFRAGRTPLAAVLSMRFRAFHRKTDRYPALARCVDAVLAESGALPTDIGVVAPLDTAERYAVAEHLLDADPTWLDCRGLFGDTGAAATGLQLAAVLAAAERAPVGRLALVTATDRNGMAGAMLLDINAQ